MTPDTVEDTIMPDYLKGVWVIFDWCLYNSEMVFVSWNYEESEKRQKPVFDIAYCATKAMNGIFLNQRVWSKRFQPRPQINNNE